MNSPGMWPLKGARHQKQLKINSNKAYFPFSLLTWEFHQNRWKKGEESIVPNFPFILKKNSTKKRSNVNEAFFSISLQSNLEENDQSNNHIWKLTKVQEIQKYKKEVVLHFKNWENYEIIVNFLVKAHVISSPPMLHRWCPCCQLGWRSICIIHQKTWSRLDAQIIFEIFQIINEKTFE